MAKANQPTKKTAPKKAAPTKTAQSTRKRGSTVARKNEADLKKSMSNEADKSEVMDAEYELSPAEQLEKETNFLKDLSKLLNRYSKDVECSTPDFILAEYVGLNLKSLTHRNALLSHFKYKR